MQSNCSICGTAAEGRPVKVRSGRELTLWHCTPCDFDFFAHDPTDELAANKLDESRLKAAGLDIPALERDFANGIAQSRALITDYCDASDQGANLLEIGCSWGYFLKLARDAGAQPWGVELNTVRAQYVHDELGIPCDISLDACESRGIRFRKIFLFYVLEYVADPVSYLQRLLDMLEPGGSLIMITPNLRDALKDLWRNEGFRRFFFDENAVNYMTPGTVERLFARLRGARANISTRQGYSFVNHASWFLTNAPRTTGVVGGDNFIGDIVTQLHGPAGVRSPHVIQHALAERLAGLVARFDSEYRQALESAQYGNQIRIVATK
jgi:hypothetical protein